MARKNTLSIYSTVTVKVTMLSNLAQVKDNPQNPSRLICKNRQVDRSLKFHGNSTYLTIWTGDKHQGRTKLDNSHFLISKLYTATTIKTMWHCHKDRPTDKPSHWPFIPLRAHKVSRSFNGERRLFFFPTNGVGTIVFHETIVFREKKKKKVPCLTPHIKVNQHFKSKTLKLLEEYRRANLSDFGCICCYLDMTQT